MLKVRDVVKGRFGGNFLYVNEVVRRFLRIVLLDELPTCRHRKVEDSEQLLLFLDNLVENPSVVDVGHVDIVELGQKFMVAVIVHPILLLAILPNGSLIVNFDPSPNYGAYGGRKHLQEELALPSFSRMNLRAIAGQTGLERIEGVLHLVALLVSNVAFNGVADCIAYQHANACVLQLLAHLPQVDGYGPISGHIAISIKQLSL